MRLLWSSSNKCARRNFSRRRQGEKWLFCALGTLTLGLLPIGNKSFGRFVSWELWLLGKTKVGKWVFWESCIGKKALGKTTFGKNSVGKSDGEPFVKKVHSKTISNHDVIHTYFFLRSASQFVVNFAEFREHARYTFTLIRIKSSELLVAIALFPLTTMQNFILNTFLKKNYLTEKFIILIKRTWQFLRNPVRRKVWLDHQPCLSCIFVMLKRCQKDQSTGGGTYKKW